ncbi:MAG: type II toxin-antitoxin system HicB family antitoxin [Desulfobacteraceae bacterium]|nr:type II toxin-antitoxin system HicB family antitoxin [Desulfobacteraceae bacterium]
MQINAIIEHDQDGFFAYVPSLKGCVSQGDTLEWNNYVAGFIMFRV